jgi:CO/xanthine dehydrogenase Mo-binding subunit
MDSGAYAGELAVMPSVAFHVAGAVYEVGAARVTVRLIYTNTPPTGAMRGVVGVAMYSALERHMDHIARELGADRRDYRLRHLFKDGSSLLNAKSSTTPES